MPQTIQRITQTDTNYPICIAHAAEDSKTLEFAEIIVSWGKPVFTFDTPANKSLFARGVQAMERRWTHRSVQKNRSIGEFL